MVQGRDAAFRTNTLEGGEIPLLICVPTTSMPAGIMGKQTVQITRHRRFEMPSLSSGNAWMARENSFRWPTLISREPLRQFSLAFLHNAHSRSTQLEQFAQN